MPGKRTKRVPSTVVVSARLPVEYDAKLKQIHESRGMAIRMATDFYLNAGERLERLERSVNELVDAFYRLESLIKAQSVVHSSVEAQTYKQQKPEDEVFRALEVFRNTLLEDIETEGGDSFEFKF